MMGSAAPAVQTAIGQGNPVAIGFFILFVALTLGITYCAAKRTRSAKESTPRGAA